MKNCLNENPCNQGYKNPCHDYKNPCQGVREDEVVIKQYIDECGRKVYPITTDSAVLLEDGSNLKEALQNYITYLNSIQEELSNLKGDHSEYNEKFLDIIARIRILEKMQSNPYTFDITSILSRLTALEAKSNLGCDTARIDECLTLCNLISIAINNINTQIQELFNLIGENCISDFSTPVVLEGKEITSDSNPTVENRRQILSYSGSDVLVYNVTPGSTINIRVDIANSTGWSSDSSYRETVGRGCELYQFYSLPLLKGYEGSQWLIEGVNGENFNATSKCAYDAASATYVTDAIVVPNNAKCVAVTRQHLTASGKTLNCNITVTLVNCPEEDEDTCWFEEWIGNLKDDYKKLQKVLDEIKVSDVQFAGESIVDNKKIATVPPFVAIHGYIKPTDSLSRWREYKDLNNVWLQKSEYVYNTGYFLDASLRNYNDTNRPKINRGILLPVTKLYDYALYNKNLNLYEDWDAQKGNLLDAHPGMGYLPYSQQLTKGVIWASPALYDKTVTPNKEKCGATTNYVVDFYDISNRAQYYNLKITFKNQYGNSCRYSLFTRVCSDLTYPDTEHISNADTDDGTILGAFNSSLIETSNVYVNYANETTSITLEDIPSTAKTLCVAYHSFGSAVVEKLPKKIPETNINSLVIPTNGTVIIKDVDLADVNAIETACRNSGLSCTNNNGNITITNNSDSDVPLSLSILNKYVVIFPFEPIETDETPTPMENVPMLTIPRPLTAVVVNYYNKIAPTDTNPTVITFNLVPRVPFYEIDTLRFMYIDESGRFYEC